MDMKDKASTREQDAREKQAQHDASLEAFKVQEKAKTERLSLIANLEIKKAEAVSKGEDGKPVDTSAIDAAIAELKNLPMEMNLPQMTMISGNGPQAITREEFLAALQALIQAQKAPKEVRVIRNNGLPVAAQVLSS